MGNWWEIYYTEKKTAWSSKLGSGVEIQSHMTELATKFFHPTIKYSNSIKKNWGIIAWCHFRKNIVLFIV